MEQRVFLDQLADMVELPPGTLTGEEKLADLDGWNSIALMSFIAFADEHFGKNLSPRQFTTCNTVTDLGKLLGVGA